MKSRKVKKPPKKSNKSFLLITMAFISIIFFGLTYWSSLKRAEAEKALAAEKSHLLIRPHSLVKGTENAKVTIVEFLDPECEACRAMHPIMKRLLLEYEGKIRLVIRYMPGHGNSRLAAAVLEEARELGKFDEAIDILFETQPVWGDHQNPKPELIATFLKDIIKDEKRLERSYLFSKHMWKIDLDQSDATKVEARKTPTFFVNERMLSYIGYDPLKEAIEKELSR